MLALASETIPPPEILRVSDPHVACDGPGGASSHPRVFLRIGTAGLADCGYCDRRYVMIGGAADQVDGDKAAVPGQDDLSPDALRGENH